MKTEAQRIAIAEACGWTAIMVNPGFAEPRKFPRGVVPGGHSRTHGTEELPDYLNDLNAMHEAEDSLGVKADVYEFNLDAVSKHYSYRATAAQRAEAFLKTIGKWEKQP